MTREQFAAHAAQVPEDFRFLVKAHEACTIGTWPSHPRYGQRKGMANELCFDVDHAKACVVDPMMEGLGPKAGPLLFQVAPQSLKPFGGRSGFLDRLHGFLRALPKGPLYAVEIRNRELLGDDYRALLADAGALHCLNALGRMPPLAEQSRLTQAAGAGVVVIRWMLNPAFDHEGARDAYEPFDKLVDEDVATRRAIAHLALDAAREARWVYIIVNNKAEGSSPLSIFRLAAEIADAARVV